MIRVRQAGLLLRPLVRAVPLAPLPAAAGFGLLVLSLEGDVLHLRLAAVALCAGAAFSLDDAAAATTASSPTPLLIRRLLRVAVVAPVAALLWVLLAAYAGESPATPLGLELAAMLAVTLAVAAASAPFVPEGRGGLAAAPALLVLLGVAALALPDGWSLFAAGPHDPRWTASHERWSLFGLLALLVLVYASLDPCRARMRARIFARRV